jgi:histone H3/H4
MAPFKLQTFSRTPHSNKCNLGSVIWENVKRQNSSRCKRIQTAFITKLIKEYTRRNQAMTAGSSLVSSLNEFAETLAKDGSLFETSQCSFEGPQPTSWEPLL